MRPLSRIVSIVLALLFASGGSASAASEEGSNTYYGTGAGAADSTGDYNTFLGFMAGSKNSLGFSNTFIGNFSGFGTTTGWQNTFLGDSAGVRNITGNGNTFVGTNAGFFNTTGSSNTFMGQHSGINNTTGSFNTFYGNFSGYNHLTGSHNNYLGYASGYSNRTGVGNIYLGGYAGYNNTSGSANTYLGFSAGLNNVSGGSNIFLGNYAGYFETGSNMLYIDNSATSMPLIHGDLHANRLTINGSMNVTGSLTKGSGSFVQPHATDPTKEIVYAFFEGPEHAVFLRGKAKLLGGKTVIETPEHFRMVAGDDEDITVQFTPRSIDTFGLAAVKVSREKIEVRELKQGTGSFEFDYFITAKRRGFEAHQPMQPNTHFTADNKGAEDFEAGYTDSGDLTINAMRRLLISNGILSEEGKLNRQLAAKLGWNVKDTEMAAGKR